MRSALLAFGLLCAATPAARADNLGEAKAAFATGKAAFERGDYDTALSKFQHANLLAPAPTLSYNIGRTYEAMGRYRDAVLAFQRFLELSGTPRSDEDKRFFAELRQRIQADQKLPDRPIARPTPPPPQPAPPPPLSILGRQIATLAPQKAAGQIAASPVYAGFGPNNQEVPFMVTLQTGRCYTFIGTVGPGAEQLSIYLFDPTGKTVIKDTTDKAIAPSMTWCTKMPGVYKLLGKVKRGQGELAIQAFTPRG